MYIVPFNALTSLLSNVVGTVINLFFSVLFTLIPIVVEIVITLLTEILNAFLYKMVFVPLLFILETLQEAIEIFAGIRNVTYMNTQDNLFNIILFRSGLSNAFWAITLIGLIIAVFATILSISKTSSGDERYTVSAILGRLGRTCLTFLIVPFITISCLNLTAMIFKKTDEMISLASGMGGNITIENVLFAAITVGAERYTEPGEGGMFGGARAPYFNGQKHYSNTNTVFGQGTDFTQQDNSTPALPDTSSQSDSDAKEANEKAVGEQIENIKSSEKYAGGDFNISKMQVIPGVLGAIYFVFLYCAAILLFIFRMMEIVILYIVCPLFTGSIPFDDGEKFGRWREIFIAKILSGFSMVVGMKLYTILLLPMIMDTNVQFIQGGGAGDTVLRLVLLAGFGFAVFQSFSIITKIINPTLAYTETANARNILGMLVSPFSPGAGAAIRGSGQTASAHGRIASQQEARLKQSTQSSQT